MSKLLCAVGIAVSLLGLPRIAAAQHGGHGGGHAGGMSHVGGGGAGMAHYYGGAGGMHAPVAPVHVPAAPPVHMPGAMHMPPAHLPSAGQLHYPEPGIGAGVGNGVGAGVATRAPHAAHVPGNTTPNTHAVPPTASTASPAAQIEAARLAALESRYWGSPWAYGYPSYYSYYGLAGVPYFGAAPVYSPYSTYGYNYAYPSRPYYYGYLSGVPYINYNNYSPVYYSDYNSLPSTTGTITVQNDQPSDPNVDPNASSPDGSTPAALSDANANASITLHQAREAIVQAERQLATGQYQLAVKNAGKAAFQLHEESRVHEVLWLALMGLADYRGAAIEAHAVDHFGVTPRWNDIAMKHEDPTRFAEQMKKLEAFAQRNQDSDFAAFLLGYNYLVLGQKEDALKWLEKAQNMDPQDTLCAKLVSSLKADTAQAEKPQAALKPESL